MKITLLKTDISGVEKQLERLNYLIEQCMFAYGIGYDHVFDDELELVEPAVFEYSEEDEIIREHVNKILKRREEEEEE